MINGTITIGGAETEAEITVDRRRPEWVTARFHPEGTGLLVSAVAVIGHLAQMRDRYMTHQGYIIAAEPGSQGTFSVTIDAV